MKPFIVFIALIAVVFIYFSTPFSISKVLKEWNTSKINYENTTYEIITNDNLYKAEDKLKDAYNNLEDDSEQTITNLNSIVNDHQHSFILIIIGFIILLYSLKFFYTTFIREVLDFFF